MDQCLSRDQMERLLDEQLDPGERDTVGDHVENCPVCQERLGGLIAVGDPASACPPADAGEVPADDDFLRDLMAKKPSSELFRLASAGFRWGESVPVPHHESTAASVQKHLPQIAGFQIVREVGRGGMGVVYEATDLALGRRVALKVLTSQMLNDPSQVLRFEREARSAANLHHTNIVPVFGVGEHDGTHFYVMQFIQGRGLDAVLAERQKSRHGDSSWSGPGDPPGVPGRTHSAAAIVDETGAPLPRFDSSGSMTTEAHCDPALFETGRGLARQVARIGVQVAEALAYAHAQGIVHRDIKPSNLLLDARGTVWVADFGLAKAVGADDLTHSGFIVGTLRYMAPERFRGQADTRADIYALGLTLYELLAGRPAFEKSDPSSLILQVTQEEPPRLRKLNRHVPNDLETIVHTAIAREPEGRYATAHALAEDLQRFLDGRPSLARRVNVAERGWRWCRRNPIVAGLTAAVFALLVAVAAIASAGYLQTKLALRGEGHQRTAAEAARAEAKLEAVRARAAEQEMRRQWYAASINLMQPAWDMGQLGRLKALLEETEPYPNRGFEWCYWQRLCHLEEHTLIGHRAQVKSVAWSPDGRLVATASMDGTARVWEASTGRERLALKGHTSPVTCAAWSPDGALIATASWDGTTKVWVTSSGRELLTLAQHIDWVNSVTWSPDGKLLATAGRDATAIVWDLQSRQLRHQLAGHVGPINSISWSPDGRFLATGGADATARISDAKTGLERVRLDGHTGPVNFVSWSPDTTLLTTGSSDGTAKVWEAKSGRARLTLTGHAASVLAVMWSPDGQLVATGGADGTVILWEASDGRQRLTLNGHVDNVLSVAWSPDAKHLATASADGTAKMWQAVDNRERLTLKAHAGAVNSVAWSPDGKLLATGGTDRTAKLWAASSGRNLLTLSGNTGAVNSVAWSPDGHLLATGSADGRARLWSTIDGREPLALIGKHAGWVNSVAWSPDGRLLATASRDGTAKLWDASDGRHCLTLQGQTGGLRSVAWSPDGWLVTGSADGTARSWDAAGTSERLILKGHLGEVSSASWSPDGRFLATGSLDGTVKIWEASGGTEMRTLEGHWSAVWSVSWSPDGTRLATGSDGGALKVWEVADGRELLTLKRHTGAVRSVSWSPDGRRIATGSDDGTAKVYDAADSAAIQNWASQDRTVREVLAKNAFQGPLARGFIKDWLVLVLTPSPGNSGARALDLQQIPNEARIRPQPGDQVLIENRRLEWQPLRSQDAVLDFNAVLQRMAKQSLAYAVCYVETDEARDGLWLQVASDDQSKVYVNGTQVYCYRLRRPLLALDTVGPIALLAGTNVVVFKVVNEGANWAGCMRFVDDAGTPVEGIRVKLEP